MILIKNILAKLVASIHILLDMVNRKIVKDSNIKESMKEYERIIYNVIGCLLVIPFYIAGVNLLKTWLNSSNSFNWGYGTVSVQLFFYALAFVTILLTWIIFRLRVIILKRQEEHALELSNKERECKRKIDAIEKDYQSTLMWQKSINAHMSNMIKTKTPFKEVANLFADFETAIYEKDEKYLRYKIRPARHAADIVSSIRKNYYESIAKYKVIQYEYELILKLFPEIKAYIDDEETIVQMAQYSSLNDLNDRIDRVRYWIRDEEYKSLSEIERNQLALDRYKNRKKSKWEIGIEYELYIGYLLREGKPPFNRRYRVVPFGELNGINDLGRDIIAETYDSNGEKTVLIIQCKRWSEAKMIHENAICQLFGTAMEYQIKRATSTKCKYVPLFITTTELSEMAKEFAKRLNVQVLPIPMGEYPMIKCNINGDSKIYHLPFDQQYHRTQIKNEGEFFAFTVAEAVHKGFRRAMRHFN